MPADFVPFLPSLRQRAAAPASFTPVAAPAPGPPTGGAPGEPRVEVKRSGDRITHLQITCRCGEVIEVACEY